MSVTPISARAYPAADAAVTSGGLSNAATASGQRLALLTVDDLVTLLQVKKSWIYDEVEAGPAPVSAPRSAAAVPRRRR